MSSGGGLVNQTRRASFNTKVYQVPSSDVVISIVLPTILFCIALFAAMLLGINKCKQWELDKIVEMRRTRRVVQRITARLREKNVHTIQKARSMRQRKRASSSGGPCSTRAIRNVSTQFGTSNSCSTATDGPLAPPSYSIKSQYHFGTSPPPSYEDALLDEFFNECCYPSRY